MQTFSFTTLNAHLMGRLGMIGSRETGLYFHDEERASEITERLVASPDDAVGLTEIWDQRLGQGIINGVRGTFPYSVYAPYANGIGDVLDYFKNNVFRIWPGGSDYLVRKTEDIVDHFAQSHYRVGRRSLLAALRVFVPEDWVIWTLSRALSQPLFWGAGLLLLSRHPIEETSFLPFTARADLERFAGKGILQATLRPAGEEPLTVLLTHYQEGDSTHAREARKRQIAQTVDVADRSPHPIVVLGDMNIDADSEEYFRMLSLLKLRDTYRAVPPDRLVTPGYTYDHDNPYAARLGVKGSARQDGRAVRQRIDYILSDPRLVPVWAEVLLKDFMAASGAYYLSDHLAYRARLQKAVATAT